MTLPTPYYSRDGITIYHGDCREILPHLKADVVISDPPYGVGYAEWDADIPDLRWLELARESAPVVLFTPGNGIQYRYPAPDWTLAWARPGSVQHAANKCFSHWEPILVYGKNPMKVDCRVFSPNGDEQTWGHPCSKPLSVMRWLVAEGCQDGGTILDPFMGSGTTLVAAKLEGRRAIGIEIEERYCEIAAKRLSQGVLNFEAAQ